MKRWLGAAALLLVLLVAVVVARTLALRAPDLPSGGAGDEFAVDAPAVGERLAGAIRFRTISLKLGENSYPEEFEGFEAYLREAYPLVHASLGLERVGAHSLLYHWPGRDPDALPLLLAAHHDVVPVDPGTEGDWEQPPFGGEIVDGVVWGRGAIDDKGGVISILDAVESLLAQGYTPARGVYLAFGHDEEVGGDFGALAMANLLAERGVRLEAAVDEGGVVAEGMLDFVDRPVAVIGIAEKGSISLQLQVRVDGGHSSTPPPQSAVGIIAAAVHRLEQNPFPASFGDTTRGFLEGLAPALPFAARAAIANLWLTAPLLTSTFSGNDAMNAMVRTTTAATIFHSGVKSNVLPKQATAVVNFRILPGETVESVTAHVRDVVDDERIEIGRAPATTARNPSGVSPIDSDAYRALSSAIQAVHPDAIVAPYLVLGGTDARHYAILTHNVYRFGGFRLGTEALRLAHGTNERVSLENLAHAVRFYRALIRGDT